MQAPPSPICSDIDNSIIEDAISIHWAIGAFIVSGCFYPTTLSAVKERFAHLATVLAQTQNGCIFPTIGQWTGAYAYAMENATTSTTARKSSTAQQTPSSASNAEFRRQLGVRIASLRAGRGMSQRQFALVLELDRVTLNRIESGSGNPTLGTLERIAEGLGISLSELLAIDN